MMRAIYVSSRRSSRVESSSFRGCTVGERPDAIALSIVVATAGRDTLGASVESATSQMRAGDELLIVFDDSGDAGDTPRNRVLGSLRGTHIMFLDDDDELVPGALDLVR